MDEKNNVIDEEKNREIYFDILKIVACFFVIILHVAARCWYNTDIYSFEWNVLNFYDGISRWTVPVFVMVSGAIFLNKDDSVKKIYIKNISKLVVVFFVWSYIYLYINGKQDLIYNVFKLLIGNFHMWFIYMIIGLYIMTPIFKCIVKDKFLTKYFLILCFIFSFAIPQIITIASFFEESLGAVLQLIIDNFHFTFVSEFAFYYIIGYCLNKVDIKKKTRNLIYFMGICGFILTFLLSTISSRYINEPSELFFRWERNKRITNEYSCFCII